MCRAVPISAAVCVAPEPLICARPPALVTGTLGPFRIEGGCCEPVHLPGRWRQPSHRSRWRAAGHRCWCSVWRSTPLVTWSSATPGGCGRWRPDMRQCLGLDGPPAAGERAVPGLDRRVRGRPRIMLGVNHPNVGVPLVRPAPQPELLVAAGSQVGAVDPTERSARRARRLEPWPARSPGSTSPRGSPSAASAGAAAAAARRAQRPGGRRGPAPGHGDRPAAGGRPASLVAQNMRSGASIRSRSAESAV